MRRARPLSGTATEANGVGFVWDEALQRRAVQHGDYVERERGKRASMMRVLRGAKTR